MMLGRRRMEEFFEAHSKLQFMTTMLTLSLASVPAAGYSDEALEVLCTDAEDVRTAAGELTEWVNELADDWRAQRQEARP